MLHSLDEARRLDILRRYAILDTPPEEMFDRIAQMASLFFKAPIGTVTFVDEARQWFKAIHGLDISETGRDVAFCHYTIQSDVPLLIGDTVQDPRFVGNPLVTGAPNIRFYAGAPLITTDGFRLGTVSAIDTVPHPDVTLTDCTFLQHLAAIVVHELEMRLAASDVKAEIQRRVQSEAALRKTEAERAESLALLHTMLEGIPDPLFFKDRDGRYTVANHATALALGADNVVGKTDIELLPAVQAERFRATDSEVMATGAAKIVEETVGRDEGRWFMTVKIPLRDEAGEVIGVVGLARDVTERRAMVEQLRQAKEQAEAANRAKTSFLAAASHDLRQPVQALVLFTSVLQGRLKGHPAAQVVGRMKHSVDALQALLESLLDISRLDAGVVSVNRHPFPVAEMLSRLGAEYGILAKRKGLKLRTVACRDWTLADAVLLERVVRNLMENAIRYTERGGVLIGCRRRGESILMQVVDTGVGIPADRIELIFQEFHQLGNPERDRTKGLGLGLSIVRRLLALMGHHLEVRSIPGVGSCFTIVLPRSEPAAIPLPPPVPGICGLTVLIIDDEVIVRQSLEFLLQDWGCHVLVAADAGEAVEQAVRQSALDVIIADYRLQGGRKGTEAVEAVRRACGHAVPAIIITGDTAPERIAEVQRSGFLLAHKPVSGDVLQRLIRTALV